MDQGEAASSDVPFRGERRLAGDPLELLLGDHVGFALRLAYQRASANLTEAVSAYAITPMQFQTLLRLRQHGPITQNQLGRSVGMPSANIHATVRRLVRAGLVATRASDTDRRVSVVALTDLGEATLTALQPLADAANRRTLSALSVAEQRMVMQLLRKLAGGR